MLSKNYTFVYILGPIGSYYVYILFKFKIIDGNINIVKISYKEYYAIYFLLNKIFGADDINIFLQPEKLQLKKKIYNKFKYKI